MADPSVGLVDPKNHIASVEKAVRLLELFDDETPQLTLAEMVRRGGYTRTTTHRLVTTLERLGWLARSGETYQLTLRVFRLAAIAVNPLQLREQARPLMSELAAQHGENVYLVVPDGPRAVCVECIKGRSPVQIMTMDVGTSLPLYIGGGSLALLAEREAELLPAVLAELPSTTPTGQSLTEATLRAKLQTVRDGGYSRSIEDVTLSVGAFGAPIFNAEGLAVAAVSVGGLVQSLLPKEPDLVQSLGETASKISGKLGYQASRPKRAAAECARRHPG